MHSLILFGALAYLSASGSEAAEKPWVGKWESIEGRQEHFKEFVQGIIIRSLSDEEANAKVVHEIIHEGDHYKHKMAVPSANYNNAFQFKLNEEGSHTLNGTEFKFKYREEGDKLIGDITYPKHNKTIHEESQVKNDELEKSYKVGDVHAKRWFKKQA